jgi:hypothetical protein
MSSIVPVLSWLLRPSLLSNRSSIVDRVTRGFLVPHLHALIIPSQYLPTCLWVFKATWSYGQWQLMILQVYYNIYENMLFQFQKKWHWRWKQHIPQNRLYPSSRLHDARIQISGMCFKNFERNNEGPVPSYCRLVTQYLVHQEIFLKCACFYLVLNNYMWYW